MTDGIDETGIRLLEKKRELVDYRQKLVNVELTLEAAQSCLFVFDICNRISVQIANKKYFSALRMIQELQAFHLKLLRKFSFSKMIGRKREYQRDWSKFIIFILCRHDSKLYKLDTTNTKTIRHTSI
jgi:hypothetical protein